MGLDLTVESERMSCPVVGIEGDSLKILKDGTAIRLPHQAGKYKTTFSPRVSRSHLEIEHVQTRRVDSRSDERVRDAMSQLILMDVVRSEQQAAALDEARRTGEVANLEAARAARGFSNDTAGAQQTSAAAANTLNDAFTAPAFAAVLPGANFGAESDSGVGGLFDAYEVDFAVSSAAKIEDAYGVLRLIVRDPANARQLTAAVEFFAVPQLGPKPRHFTVVVHGLPRGFGVETYAVHIFSNGREFPTNLSKNRVGVNEEEAHQFLVLQYLQQHSGASRPVAVIPELRPDGLRALIGADHAQATIDLGVDHKGHVTALQQTGDISTPLASGLVALLRGVRFFPELLNGEPVDGRVVLPLSELTR